MILDSVREVVLRACGPRVDVAEGGTGSEDGLALFGKHSNVGELMAVKLNNIAESPLLRPLSGESLSDVINMKLKNIDLGFVLEGHERVHGDSSLVHGDLSSVMLEVVLGMGDSVRELKDFETDGLDGEDLVRVDIDLLLVALLIGEWGVDVEGMHGVVVDLRDDGDAGRDVSDLSTEVDGGDGGSNGSESSSEFHFYLVVVVIIKFPF